MFYKECKNGTYQIKPIANYQNLGVLNLGIFSSSDSQILQIASFVNLDSNIVSLLPKYFKKENNQNFADLADLIEYIINEKLNISSIPYFLEDSLNSSGMKMMKRFIRVLYIIAFYADYLAEYQQLIDFL